MVDQVTFVAIANDEINAWEGRDCAGIHFCVAAGDDEERFWMTPMCLSDELTRAAVTEMCDSAGIDDIDIRAVVKIALLKPG